MRPAEELPRCRWLLLTLVECGARGFSSFLLLKMCIRDSNMNQLMKQAQQMQQKLAEAQESMNEVTVDASAGGGMVKVTVDGAMQLKSVTIDPDALDPEDVEMLQDMIVAAVNEACRGVAEIANKRMSAVTGGMGAGIPGMPF